MKCIILLSLICSLSASDAPVFGANDLNGTEYVLDDGLIISNAILFQRIVNERTWTNVQSTGITFTFSHDKEGNIEFTWDNLLYGNKVSKSFIVFYKKPILGLRWNPDGIEIRIEELNVVVSDHDGENVTDLYGFYKDNILVTSAWVSRENGIVKVTRLINGIERTLTRRKKKV